MLCERLMLYNLCLLYKKNVNYTFKSKSGWACVYMKNLVQKKYESVKILKHYLSVIHLDSCQTFFFG